MSKVLYVTNFPTEMKHTSLYLIQAKWLHLHVLVLAIVLASFLGVHAEDPDITSDFLVLDEITPDANFFTFNCGAHLRMRHSKGRKIPRLNSLPLKGNAVSYAAGQWSWRHQCTPLPPSLS